MVQEDELPSVVENGSRQHSTDPAGHIDSDASSEVRHRVGPGHRKLHNSWAPSQEPSPETSTSDPDGEEGADSLHKFWHRAGWLVLLLFCQSTSSVILEHFELLVKTHPVVVYFLTMLVGAGGNAGGQSTVLVVRRLALAAANGRGRESLSFQRIVGAEVTVGAQLALVLGLACFVRCIVFQVRGEECLAICLSMLAITFSSTLIGAALPLLLGRLKIDPAHAGATIQVVMDISGVTVTCIVSCLCLGVPLSSASVGQEVPEEGISIPRHSRDGLSSFGGKATGYDHYR